jgi:hypothetical protein
MKRSDAIQKINQGWIRRPKGFRIRFETYAEGKWENDVFPAQDEALLSSEILAWEMARRFAAASSSDAGETIRNVTVIDDLEKLVPYYATNEVLFFLESPM